jgi:ribosomal protein L37AE/L43A
MDKYGVSEDLEQTKEAQHEDHPKCPECKAELCDSNNTGVLLCPNCGSRPFEQSE